MTASLSQRGRVAADVDRRDDPHAPIIVPPEVFQVEQLAAEPVRAPLWPYLLFAAAVAAVIVHHFHWQAQL